MAWVQLIGGALDCHTHQGNFIFKWFTHCKLFSCCQVTAMADSKRSEPITSNRLLPSYRSSCAIASS
ncbi:hypothetical protein [Nostoc sp.]|uniref:hypothetical protein n=1 Tax=Nostoc sp. TaxID=1180 RepID=UPI002FF53A11